MEYWLIYSEEEKLRLPVPPSSFELQTGNNNTTVNVNSAGEVNIIGKKKLDGLSFSTFFPSKNYTFQQYSGYPKPYDCVALIKKWRDSGKPIRIIITDTDINHTVSIEDFNYGEEAGTRDVKFTLTLKEYRYLKVQSQEKQQQTTTTSETLKDRATEKTTPAEYIVKAGDTLYIIAKKVYGKGELWRNIANKNNIKDPKTLKVGQRLLMS